VDIYLYLKAAHIIAMVAWMAGIFYLPRLYVYHVGAAVGSEMSETFKLMERRLLRAIINPAMIATWVIGLILMFGYLDWRSAGWMHAKLTLVILLTIFHVMLARWRKDFEADRNSRTERFYRIANEVPTLLLVLIVILAIVKPF